MMPNATELFAAAGVDRYCVSLLAALAHGLAPRERVRPSAWAEANVVLTEVVSPERPGPWSSGHFPWTRCVLDLEFDNPDKSGDITIKCAQIGNSLNKLVRRACKCATDPAPFLYLITDETQAKHFVAETWTAIVDSVPALRRLFEQGSEDRREVLLERPMPGGRMDFAGAGSPAGVSSRTYREVDIDEFDQVEKNFPSNFGGVYNFVQGRFRALRGATWFSAWSHPTHDGVGIHRLWRDLSDQGRWVFDCPHCDRTVAPRWTCVRFMRTLGDDAAPDPESAVFECPHCNREITDAERQRAVWPSREHNGREGGSGRRESALAPEEAMKRPYAGLAISGLCDPYRTIVSFARQFCSCQNDRDRQAFRNVMLGEEDSPTSGTVMNTKQVREMIGNRLPALPGGRRGVQFVCGGTDVQAPRQNPTLYHASVAFGAHGHDYLVGLHKVSGFAAWTELVAQTSVRLDDGQVLGTSDVGIDDGYESGQVKDACRFTTVYAHATSTRVRLVPVRFVASSTLNRDNPFILRGEKKRIHPSRPELGMIDMYDLHRHSWVERVLLKIGGRVLHVACEIPPDLEAHLTSQLLTPKKSQHGNWQENEMEWDRGKDRRDDWLMAIVYAYVVAVIKCGLDRIHLLASDPELISNGKPRVVAPQWGRKAY